MHLAYPASLYRNTIQQIIKKQLIKYFITTVTRLKPQLAPAGRNLGWPFTGVPRDFWTWDATRELIQQGYKWHSNRTRPLGLRVRRGDHPTRLPIIICIIYCLRLVFFLLKASGRISRVSVFLLWILSKRLVFSKQNVLKASP